MRIIGLTGGIASGKSSVAGMLERLGAAVVDADQLARDVVIPGSVAHTAIVGSFGAEIMNSDGSIDRKRLGGIVFSDPEARSRLESIIHPEIKRLAEERLAGLRESGAPVAIYMAPLLVEAGAVDRVDEIWVVYVDEPTQIERLMKRDRITREEAVRRIESQMPMSEKKGYGKVVIDNSGEWEETERQVMDIWKTFILG